MKHIDFIILDVISLQAALILADACSGYGGGIYTPILYRTMAILLGLMERILLGCRETMRGVIRRDHFVEFIVAVKQAVFIEGSALLYLFLLQEGQKYSRLALMLTAVFYIGPAYSVRECWKWHLQRKKTVDGNTIAGVCLIGDHESHVGEKIEEIPVIVDEEELPHYVCQGWIDEVIVVTSEMVPYPDKLLNQLTETGVTVHLNLAKVTSVPGKRQFVEKIGPYTVLTTSINYASSFQLFLKRMMDCILRPSAVANAF